MTEKLKTPPLITTFCRFDYKPADELDWTIPGSLFEVLKAQYPKKQQLFGYEVEIEEEQPAEPSSIAKNPIGMEFSNPDRTRFVRVGPAFLEVRQSETYSGWDHFETDILDIYDTHHDIAENPRLMGISLRYINRVKLKKSLDSLDQTITLLPHLQGALDRPLDNFYQQYSIRWNEPPGRLIHRTGTPGPDQRDHVMIDLEFRIDDIPESSDDFEIPMWLGQAHTAIYEAFRDSLKADYFEHLRLGTASTGRETP